jgi:hypothetical protein
MLTPGNLARVLEREEEPGAGALVRTPSARIDLPSRRTSPPGDRCNRGGRRSPWPWWTFRSRSGPMIGVDLAAC